MKGFNLALQWQGKVLHVKTDAVCVYNWILDTLTRKVRVSTKTASKMLIRRQLRTLKEFVKEYALTVDVMLVPLTQNIADRLTQVSQWGFEVMKKENEPEPLIGAAHADKLDVSQIMAIHRGSGHPGVRRTTYFVGEFAQKAIRLCEECQSIDPALIQWEKGKLKVNRNWQRLGMGIKHYSTRHFLTLTDCGPSRFSIWKQLVRQDSASVIHQLEVVFFQCGPLHEILTDNDTAFHNKEFQASHMSGGFRYAYALMISLCICPSQEWHSRAMSSHSETDCSQDVLSHTGGCLLV